MPCSPGTSPSVFQRLLFRLHHATFPMSISNGDIQQAHSCVTKNTEAPAQNILLPLR